MISFQQKAQTVENAITGESYSLQAIDSIQPTEAHIQRVTAICNEPEIYQWLYREMFDGKPYPSDSAISWISWGAKGWKDGAYFVFVVLDCTGAITAACDIKGSDMNHAEIGYWASAQHRGIMTNAVTAMLVLAEQAGFRSFFAEVFSENKRSQAVLNRVGFQLSEDKAQKTGQVVFKKSLDTQ